LLDHDVDFPQAVEEFAIEQFLSEPGVEAFGVSVFFQGVALMTRLDMKI
jgi:hypothetical protein